MNQEKCEMIERDIKWMKDLGPTDKIVRTTINDWRDSILSLGESKDMRNLFYKFNQGLIEVFLNTEDVLFRWDLKDDIVENYKILAQWLIDGKKCNPKGNLEKEKQEAEMWLAKFAPYTLYETLHSSMKNGSNKDQRVWQKIKNM
jgi:hypothetical protein